MTLYNAKETEAKEQMPDGLPVRGCKVREKGFFPILHFVNDVLSRRLLWLKLLKGFDHMMRKRHRRGGKVRLLG